MESQEDWVLLSASANHPVSAGSNQKMIDTELSRARAINLKAPSELKQKRPSRLDVPLGERWAILLPGELRCISRSKELIKQLGRYADLFVVTSEKYRKEAEELGPVDLTIVSVDPTRGLKEDEVPHAAMKQWNKLSMALRAVKEREVSCSKRYDYIVKLRSDFFFVHSKFFFRGIRQQLSKVDIGMVGASDKVFASRRDTMMVMQGFYESLLGWFYQREQSYWPININQVLESDDAIKWYGLNWPIEIIGNPRTTQSWRRFLVENRETLRSQLQSFEPSKNTEYHKLFHGDSKFASEVCFARYLNLIGISFHDCYSLRGFLYSDR